ncbi:hypothetical protein PROFUN_01685 [Planoprotostelium fungivorum]|uniref:Homeobox domain-containing protein n=1 Tax=Planoprotostelium fungivorum TaxID=1890364 RepID=A0A2P6MW93_9EUKA|nr:hypothetical protein PROFUN_01685 [Planoprotostelium fungivorum]
MSQTTSQPFRSICIFASARDNLPSYYFDAARDLAKLLVDEKIDLVYGGGNVGLMGTVAEAVHLGGGKVVGIVPKSLIPREVVDNKWVVGSMIVTKGMHDRKLEMYRQSDAFIALPGGFGTFDELLETTTWLQLGIHSKPIGILNTNGYFDAFLSMVQRATKDGFIDQETADAVYVVSSDPKELLAMMKSQKPPASQFNVSCARGLELAPSGLFYKIWPNSGFSCHLGTPHTRISNDRTSPDSFQDLFSSIVMGSGVKRQQGKLSFFGSKKVFEDEQSWSITETGGLPGNCENEILTQKLQNFTRDPGIRNSLMCSIRMHPIRMDFAQGRCSSEDNEANSISSEEHVDTGSLWSRLFEADVKAKMDASFSTCQFTRAPRGDDRGSLSKLDVKNLICEDSPVLGNREKVLTRRPCVETPSAAPSKSKSPNLRQRANFREDIISIFEGMYVDSRPWNEDEIVTLEKKTGLSQEQVQRWRYDRKRRGPPKRSSPAPPFLSPSPKTNLEHDVGVPSWFSGVDETQTAKKASPTWVFEEETESMEDMREELTPHRTSSSESGGHIEKRPTQKRRHNHSSDIVSVLEEAFKGMKRWDIETLGHLQETTGLTKKQITRWRKNRKYRSVKARAQDV